MIGTHFHTNGYAIVEASDAPGVTIGDHCEMNRLSYVAANYGGCVTIGDHVRIAHMVSIKTSHHEIDLDGPCIAGKGIFSDIKIGSGSWIGSGAIILPGVKVGKKNVIAAGAVVTKSTPDGVLMAGVPAVVKKSYIGGIL